MLITLRASRVKVTILLLGDSVSPWIMSRGVIVQWWTGRRCRGHKNLSASFCREEHWETGQWSVVPWCEQRSSIVRGEWEGITWATLRNHDGDSSKNSSLERARVYSFCDVCWALAILSACYVVKCNLFYQKKIERDFFQGRKKFRHTRWRLFMWRNKLSFTIMSAYSTTMTNVERCVTTCVFRHNRSRLFYWRNRSHFIFMLWPQLPLFWKVSFE